MQQKNYHRTITVNASPKEALKKINQVNEWWVVVVEGPTEKVGDKFRLPMGQTWVDIKITELIPAKKLVWKVTDCFLPWLKNTTEWTNTEIVFELSAKDNKTQIDFTHIGLVPEAECYEACEKGWDGHITVSLPKLINEGKGMPKKF